MSPLWDRSICGRCWKVYHYPHLPQTFKNSGCPYHPLSIVLAHTTPKCVKSSLETGQSFDYAEVRELAEPKPPEAPVLALSGKPDLKIYDRLLTGSMTTAGVCG